MNDTELYAEIRELSEAIQNTLDRMDRLSKKIDSLQKPPGMTMRCVMIQGKRVPAIQFDGDSWVRTMVDK